MGVNPGQSIGVSDRLPSPSAVEAGERQGIVDALDVIGFTAGAPVTATPIDVAFIGSCAKSRLSDLREAAAIVGSPTGRTLLMSPAMVAAAALAGEVVDVGKVLSPAVAR